jgi:vacuolar-type H+-ATPase subunit I/STV1
VVAVLGNTLIDRFGHEIRSVYGREIVRRTPLTHTLPRSAVWGSIPALVLTLLYYYVYNYLSKELVFLTLVSLLNGPSHMLLDVFTERGIYVKRNGKWKRFALAHFSYNNPAVNGMAILLGILMLFTSYYIGVYNHYYHYHY